MSDDRMEERVRASLRGVDLPAAPDRLVERVTELSGTAPARRARLGLAVVLATTLVVAGYGSLMLRSGGARPQDVPTATPSAIESVPPTASAVESVDPTATSATVTPTLRPFPVERPDPTAPAVDPALDNDLALAGRDSVPGLIDCGFGLPFNIDSIENPIGAEDLPGPEYDALRTLLAQYVALGEFMPDPTAREVARSPTTVMFLVDRQHPGRLEGFPFVPVSVDLVDGYWLGYEGVDCNPLVVLPPGYAAGTWRIDPAHSRPTPKTRALHLLVKEQSCASGRSATGRIGPAYVIATRYEVEIGVIVKERPGDCQGTPETPARLSLPEPLGDRTLRDMYAHLLSGSGG